MMGHKAVVHIFTSHNNILITATDLTGAETICKVSGGMIVSSGADQSGQFASTRAAEQIAEMLNDKDFDQVTCTDFARVFVDSGEPDPMN